MLSRGVTMVARSLGSKAATPCAALAQRAMPWTVASARPAAGLMAHRAMSSVPTVTNNTVQPIVIKTPGGAMDGSDSYVYDPYSGRDATKNNGRAEPGDPSRRAFAYFMMGSARFVYASLARLTVIKFVHFMNASADVLALASIEVPIQNIPEGGCIVVKWRGKPVFIKKRTQEELDDIYSIDWKELRDPQTDKARRIQEEILVVLGVCTHLGCVPIANAGEFKGGWFCPCHGSHYDASARIRKGPAPLNLEVPPYSFMEENILKIG